MHYQLRHVEANLRQDEAIIRALMPNVSKSDPEPLTINNRANPRKTLTYTLADFVSEGRQ